MAFQSFYSLGLLSYWIFTGLFPWRELFPTPPKEFSCPSSYWEDGSSRNGWRWGACGWKFGWSLPCWLDANSKNSYHIFEGHIIKVGIKDERPAKDLLLPENPMVVGSTLRASILESTFHLSLIDLAGQLLDRIRILKNKILLEIVSSFQEDALEVGGQPYLLVKWSQHVLIQKHFDSFWTIISNKKYQ